MSFKALHRHHKRFPCRENGWLVLNVAFGIRALDVDSLVFFHHWGILFK